MSKVLLYGDSLLKATMPDGTFRYHFHLNELMKRYTDERIEVVNRAKMGATIRKGLRLVQHDMERGVQALYALVGYGGNDSDFDWAAIAADPAGEHLPNTELPTFAALLRQTTANLMDRGIQPVLMTLPPIDAERYLRFICRDGLSRERILGWLGDVQMIYRYQELYSDTVADVARSDGLPLIDVRRAFLSDHRMSQMVAADGIHLTMPGYERLFDTLHAWLRERLDGEAVPCPAQ